MRVETAHRVNYKTVYMCPSLRMCTEPRTDLEHSKVTPKPRQSPKGTHPSPVRPVFNCKSETGNGGRMDSLLVRVLTCINSMPGLA